MTGLELILFGHLDACIRWQLFPQFRQGIEIFSGRGLGQNGDIMRRKFENGRSRCGPRHRLLRRDPIYLPVQQYGIFRFSVLELDLRDLAIRQRLEITFKAKIERLRATHIAKTSFLDRLTNAAL